MVRDDRDARTTRACGSEPEIDFEHLFRVAPIGLAVLDADLRYVLCNDALAEIHGLAAKAHIGRSIYEIIPGIAQSAGGAFRHVFSTGEALNDLKIVGDLPWFAGHPRTWLESVRPLRDAAGAVRHILVSVHEVTRLEEAEAALRETETALQASQTLNPDSFTILRAVRDSQGEVRDFVWEYANPAAQNQLCAGPLNGRSLLQVLPANREHPDLFPRYVRLLNEQASDQVELWYEEGEVRGWFRNTTVAIDPDRVAISFRNITERKRAEEQLRLVGQEYRHRVKNLLTLVSSLVAHAGRECADVATLKDTLQRQLAAMGVAQDLLGQDGAKSVGLARLATAALEPFFILGLEIAGGADVQIRSECVIPLLLALHELATNAAKHGGLSSDDGRAELTWTIQADRVTMFWAETGCPAISRPERAGFGTALLEAAKRSLPGGELHIWFEDGGLRARISFDHP